MCRFLGYMVIVICILMYAASTNKKLTTMLEAYKLRPGSIVASDRYRYGDLYGMSYLSYFRKQHQADSANFTVDTACAGNIHLYEICDSYLWSFLDNSKLYCGVDKLTIVKTNNREKLITRLDTSRINILLIELSERNIREVLRDTAYINNLVNLQETCLAKANAISTKVEKDSPLQHIKRYISGIAAFISYKDINTNIESNMWDYSVLTPVKEFKADINFRILGTVAKNVSISEDGKQLFYTPTIDTSALSSSFKYISGAEIDFLVRNLNSIAAHSKKAGFTKVYLSLIPNPVSILAPGYNGLTYNKLVQRIQQSPELQIPCIDLLPDFTHMKNSVYSSSDSHWNAAGIHIWLDKFNRELNLVSHTGLNE